LYNELSFHPVGIHSYNGVSIHCSVLSPLHALPWLSLEAPSLSETMVLLYFPSRTSDKTSKSSATLDYNTSRPSIIRWVTSSSWLIFYILLTVYPANRVRSRPVRISRPTAWDRLMR
jgi:hypothetical protein